jgi:hypothetical protein
VDIAAAAREPGAAANPVTQLADFFTPADTQERKRA